MLPYLKAVMYLSSNEILRGLDGRNKRKKMIFGTPTDS